MTHKPQHRGKRYKSAKPMTRAAIVNMFNRREKALNNLDWRLQGTFGAAPRGCEAISAAAAMKAASCRRSARLMNPAYHDSCQYETLTAPGTSGGNT
jgi:hypothetical protein